MAMLDGENDDQTIEFPDTTLNARSPLPSRWEAQGRPPAISRPHVEVDQTWRRQVSQHPKSKGILTWKITIKESLEILFHITMRCMWHSTHMCKICVSGIEITSSKILLIARTFKGIPSILLPRWCDRLLLQPLSFPFLFRPAFHVTKTKKNLQQNFIWVCLGICGLLKKKCNNKF